MSSLGGGGQARYPTKTFRSKGRFSAPVLELAYRRDLHSRARLGHPGPIPGWGTKSTLSLN